MTDMFRGFVVVAIVLGTCAPAWAQKLVAVAKVDGDRDGSVTAAVVSALDREFKVISPKAVERSAEQMDVAIDERQAPRLIADLEADALVLGSVEKTAEGQKLQLRVFPLGARKSRSAWIIYAGRPKAEKVQTGVRTAVATILAAAQAESAKSDPDEPPPGRAQQERDDEDPLGRGKVFRPVTGRPGKSRFAERTGAEATDAPKAAPRDDGARLDDEVPEVDVGLGAEELAAKRALAWPARVSAGPSVSNRSLEFNHRVFDEAPKDYKGKGVVPGVRVQGEVYPLGFSSQGALASLGVGFKLDHTFGLKITTNGMRYGTVVRNYGVDLRYRLGGKRTTPSLTLAAGYARRTFMVARGTATVDLPDVDYQMLAPGVGFRLPMGAVAFFGDVRALLVTSAGAIEKSNSYGPATITAFEAEAGLEITLNRRLALRLAGDLAFLGYAFKGTGALANSRDQDATTKDVGGAADRYMGGALTVAVSY